MQHTELRVVKRTQDEWTTSFEDGIDEIYINNRKITDIESMSKSISEISKQIRIMSILATILAVCSVSTTCLILNNQTDDAQYFRGEIDKLTDLKKHQGRGRQSVPVTKKSPKPQETDK